MNTITICIILYGIGFVVAWIILAIHFYYDSIGENYMGSAGMGLFIATAWPIVLLVWILSRILKIIIRLRE